MGVREGEQQHPIRMERGKGEPEGDRKHKITSVFVLWSSSTNTLHRVLLRHMGLAVLHSRGSEKSCLPEQVKHGGEKQLVVDGNAHVARLVEGRGHRPDSGPKGTAPAQEQKLSCGRRQ